jgi:hypothetical protein
MTSCKHVWVVGLLLLSAVVLTVAYTSQPRQVRAAERANNLVSSARVQPVNNVANSSIRTSMSADQISSDIPEEQSIHGMTSSPWLPYAEEFVLTPPNSDQGTDETEMAVRFPQLEASNLASALHIKLAGQNVTLARAAGSSNVFVTKVRFDWPAFLKMQERRKQLANEGHTVAVYRGRDFIGTERMQFVDPDQMRSRIKQHLPIEFTPQVLVGGDGLTVVPDHELMIVNPAVVEDTENGAGRTYDACISGNQGNPNGAWTFQTLWMAALNTTDVHQGQLALQSFLARWHNNQPINGFTVTSRNIGTLGSTGLLANWSIDDSHGLCNGTDCPSLQAPVRLNAIVNRIDLSDQPGQTNGGELRFVFGVTAGNQSSQSCYNDGSLQPSSGPPFNIIFEYHVPSSYTHSSWAAQWDQLPKDNFSYTSCPPSGCYIPMLQSLITDNVVKSNSCGGNTCLFHIRTNEVLLTNSPAVWELREFGVNAGSGGSPNSITEIPVDQTPDGSFNFGAGGCVGAPGNGEPVCVTGSSKANYPTTYLNTNQTTITNSEGTQPLVPLTYSPGPFQQFSVRGGSSLNAFVSGQQFSAVYWNVCPAVYPNCTARLQQSAYEARRYFSENTCNGCHGDETKTLLFQQVFNRLPGQQSSLSNFLLGCVPTSGACGASAGPDSCTVGTMGFQPGDQCPINTPGQESVLDPANASNGNHSYGDLLARSMTMQGLASPVSRFFVPFMRQRIGVH